MGVAGIGYGVSAAWARRTKPQQFKKLEPMKRFWGERAGAFVHIIGYTVVPIVLGIVLILSGLRGVSLF